MKSWTVVVFGSAGETRRVFLYEHEALTYAARARRCGCLARIES